MLSNARDPLHTRFRPILLLLSVCAGLPGCGGGSVPPPVPPPPFLVTSAAPAAQAVEVDPSELAVHLVLSAAADPTTLALASFAATVDGVSAPLALTPETRPTEIVLWIGGMLPPSAEVVIHADGVRRVGRGRATRRVTYCRCASASRQGRPRSRRW